MYSTTMSELVARREEIDRQIAHFHLMELTDAIEQVQFFQKISPFSDKSCGSKLNSAFFVK